MYCSENIFPVLISSRLIPTLSSIRFSVHKFKLRSFIHMDLGFGQDDHYRPIWILLYAAVQSDQNHLLKMLSFFSSSVFLFYQKSDAHMCVYLCLCLPFDFIDQCVLFLCQYHAVFIIRVLYYRRKW